MHGITRITQDGQDASCSERVIRTVPTGSSVEPDTTALSQPKDPNLYQALLASKRVAIANPMPGTSPFTSGASAAKHYWYGRADITDEFEIFFLTAATVVQRMEDRMVEDELARNRSGILFWNGDGDPKERHRPGDVIS